MRKTSKGGQPRELGRRNFIKEVAGTAVATSLAARAQAAGESKPTPGPQPSKTIRIGVVGGNFGCAFYWHKHPNSNVSAVCDLRDDRLQRLVETYGCTNTYKDFRTFLKEGQMDAVAVFTPAPLHVWMATEAMKAGKHVISAVPAGMSEEECEQLIDCVQTTGMKYMMAETSYYMSEVITCREWAKEGKFGTIFYAEAEYHHEGLLALQFDEHGLPTWRHGFPPMHYPTHCTGILVPVMNERLTEVTCVGWGDQHEILQTNEYENPFWNEVAFFKTSGEHCCRVSVCWHIAAGGTERTTVYGDRMSYIMARPEGSSNTVVSISQEGKVVLDANGYPQGDVQQVAFDQPNHFDKLPEPLRLPSGHGGSHTHITHEFVTALVESHNPAVDVYEAVAYTVPGIVAHKSALRDGHTLKIKDYGKATG
ncbi:MAG: Gfo/Idh/MocA family oxidoreductase [Candidatus Hydrogenedentes bacterium]|nr:Gfo/Idh/MocA family oxidoreductase [Candidatus Hydrogenedentota bacterium]